ncbi:MAG: M15 family metallopeptidase [Desulfobacula sp.]|nr:M15 family metallopeptidase [Desulfobacula sp.]
MRKWQYFCKISLLIFFIYFSFFSILSAKNQFQGSVQAIPDSIIQSMKKYSWHKECPLPLHQLSYVRVVHWGYDNRIHSGELIVSKALAREVLEIFKELFDTGFQIKSIRRIDHYQGSDDLSMGDDNTSAFNCRPIFGKKEVFSKHSYGIAIDINPLRNPYIKNEFVVPEKGRVYINRTQQVDGLIKKNGPCYKIFKKRGWIWGGDWKTLKDYQHFEKPTQE